MHLSVSCAREVRSPQAEPICMGLLRWVCCTCLQFIESVVVNYKCLRGYTDRSCNDLPGTHFSFLIPQNVD